MRDPRLVEIDFLMDLELGKVSRLQITGGGAPAGDRYGVDPMRFRDMVVSLLGAGMVAGEDLRGTGRFTEVYTDNLRGHGRVLSIRLCRGESAEVLITHEGRVRLWSLRDELLRNPDIEPMGLRSKTAWERGLFLGLRWATTEEPLAIIFLDLDNFGAVNKQLGSAVGDDVLRATFTIVKNMVGPRGQVYRFGGEEVGVLAPATSMEAARELAEELRSAIEANVHRQVPALGRNQTASVGVATFGADVDARAALERVDALMRAAKQAGKNRVVAAGE